MKILLVEDDTSLANLITLHLTTQNYVVDVVGDGAAGWSYGSTFDYDLLILDLQLPQLDGLRLCQRLRAEGDTTPVLVLTAEQSRHRKIQALDAGADDYMVKPFDIGELEARIRALVRRGQGQGSPFLMWGDLLMNPVSAEVTYGDRALKLTSTEYKLLELLITNGIHVVSLDDILERLWSSDEYPAESTVRSHVRRLRNKLQKAGAPVDFISTLHGRGYYLKSSQGNRRGKLLPQDAAQPDSGSLAAPLSSRDDDDSSIVAHRASLAPPSEALTQTAIQIQYLQFLNETWPQAKQSCLQEIEGLAQVSPEQQMAIAHRLAGTLSMFGLSQIVQGVRQLEGLYQKLTQEPDATVVGHEVAGHEIEEKRQLIERWLQETASITVLPQFPEQELPAVWILSDADDLNGNISAAATSQCLTSCVFQDWPSLRATLSNDPLPHQIIAQLEHLRPLLSQPEELKRFQTRIAKVPLLILGEQDRLGDRLQALRLGGIFLLRSQVSAEQMITASLIAAHQQSPHTQPSVARDRSENLKVMLVDDDPHLLKHLFQQLSPLGFKVTTLADPQHFWHVLQAVKPDALILDIKIPDIDGFELCQLVRHDPRLKRLPILFLSILNDPETRQRAFSMGADDYLLKPVFAPELAHRIVSRLDRIKMLSA